MSDWVSDWFSTLANLDAKTKQSAGTPGEA
jgi:hypothetical protein